MSDVSKGWVLFLTLRPTANYCIKHRPTDGVLHDKGLYTAPCNIRGNMKKLRVDI